MENNNASAFPFIDYTKAGDYGSIDYNYRGGLSKHEYAAIMIAQGFASKLGPDADFKTTVAMLDNAYNSAAYLLSKFNQ